MPEVLTASPRTHHKHGADLIKVMSTGGLMTTGSAPWYAQFTTSMSAGWNT